MATTTASESMIANTKNDHEDASMETDEVVSTESSSSSSINNKDSDFDWDALKVVDTIEELQQSLYENRYSNLLVLPTAYCAISVVPPPQQPTRTFANDGVGLGHPPSAAAGAAARRGAAVHGVNDNRMSSSFHRARESSPWRDVNHPAMYCSVLADALRSNTALTSLTLEEVPLVAAASLAPTGAGGGIPMPYHQPQPQLYWLGQSIQAHPSLNRLALLENRLGDAGVIALMQALCPSMSPTALMAPFPTSITPSTPLHGFRVPCIYPSTNTTASSSSRSVVRHVLSIPLALEFPKTHCLQSLSLCGNHIGDQGAFWISQAFLQRFKNSSDMASSSLTELDLSCNNITKKGAFCLSLLVGQSSNMTTLLLNGNAIGPEGAVALAQALHTNSQMTILGLSSNCIQDQGAFAIAQVVTHHPSLQALLLEDNHIGAHGSYAVAQAHHRNPRLGMMELSRNILDTSVMVEIASAMPTIRYLYLDHCGLDDSLVCYVADALRTNGTIHDLFLEGNAIGSAGAMALAWALETNATLEGLFLEGNPIGPTGARALCETLKTHNMTLKRLPVGPLSNNLYEQEENDHAHMDQIQGELEVYLDMNASGRRRVLQEGGLTPALWSHFLIHQAIVYDPDMIFHFHKEQPQLFNSNTRRTTTSRR